MNALMRVLYWFNMFLVWVAKACLLVMVVVVTLVVFMRYLFNTGLAWGEEIPLLLVIWFTMIAMAIGVKLKLHISMNVLPSTLPPWLDTALRKFSDIVIIGVSLVLIYYGSRLAWMTRRSILPGCGIGTYWLYLPAPVAGVMMLLDSALDFLGVDKRDEYFSVHAESSRREIREDVR